MMNNQRKSYRLSQTGKQVIRNPKPRQSILKSRKSQRFKSKIPTLAQLQSRLDTGQTDSIVDDESSYSLHPQLKNTLKLEAGSIENFLKNDDIEIYLKNSKKNIGGNFIMGKIDKIGLVGKRARMEIKRKRERERR
jgi:hypothetical protein